MKFFNQYRGLKREVYILFFGRIVTNMGALIWPMLTLILSNKMHMNASDIALLLMVMSFLQLPAILLGGKLADRFSKRNVIIFCDLITVICYLLMGFIEISTPCIVLFFIAGLFAQMEYPSYDALIADLTGSSDRERAYSLTYLGANLGLVLAPILGGLLFENHLNLAFIISSLATLSSTVLIYVFIKDSPSLSLKDNSDTTGEYEALKEGSSLWSVLSERKIMIFFIACSSVASLVYSQFMYLLPLNMDMLYGARGAALFGVLTSVNAVVVIVLTPVITSFFTKIRDVTKMLIGEAMITLGLGMYSFIQGVIPLYFVSIIIFTVGEVFMTIGMHPYMTKRIPATHRGRISGIHSIFTQVFQAGAQNGVGFLADRYEISFVWRSVGVTGILCTFMYAFLKRKDKKSFPLIYSGSSSAKAEENRSA